MDDTRAAVRAFVREIGYFADGLTNDDDLFARWRIEGDDADEFIEAFAKRFSIDMGNYRWYFHHREEGQNLGALFFRPPYARVERMPISIDVLANAVVSQEWPLAYPPHELPKRRWDIIIDQIVMALLIIGVAAIGIAKLWRSS